MDEGTVVMTVSRAECLARLQALLPEVEKDTEQDDACAEALDKAVITYSRLFPRQCVYEFVGDDSSWMFDLPSDFDPSVSKITEVEYPAGEQSPVLLDITEYATTLIIESDKPVWKLRLAVIPASTETVRIRYTGLHTLSDTESTISKAHSTALVFLAAYYMASAAAGYFGSTVRSTLDANTVNYRTKADEWRAIAEHFHNAFKASLGMTRDASVPAGGFIGHLKRPSSIFRG